MTIIIKDNKRIINELTIDQWVDSCSDDESIALMSGEMDIEDSIQAWNLNNQCKGIKHEAILR
jgi:hypothetical protein